MSEAKQEPIANTIEALHDAAMAEIQQERFDQAIEYLSKALEIEPKNPASLANTGYCHLKHDKPAKALELFDRCLEIKPNWHIAFYNRGMALHALERYDDAKAAFEKGVEFQPDHLEAKLNLATINLETYRVDEAIEQLGEILDRDPDYFDAKINLSKAYNMKGQWRQAIQVFEDLDAEQLDEPDVCLEVSKALNKIGIRYKALPLLEKALEADNLTLINKTDAASLLCSFRRYEQANLLADEVLDEEPENLEALRVKNAALIGQGRVDEAIETGIKSFELAPSHLGQYLGLIFNLNYANPPMNDLMQRITRSYDLGVKERMSTIPDFEFKGDRDPNRRLRIGIFSPDFRLHSCAYFSSALFTALDRKDFEIIGIPTSGTSDFMTAQFRRMADQWVPAYEVSWVAMAERLRDMELDIAIDLAGHTSNNALALFIHRIAPIQINWLGYPNTTGVRNMDYRIVDHITDPEGYDREHYTEELIRLDRCFLCYKPAKSLPPVEDKSSRERIIFGTFNAISKINTDVLDAWIEILKRVPDSALMVKALQFGEERLIDRVRERFVKQGVDTKRLHITGAMESNYDHLSLYNEMDIALDPFPYNGTTTTCEATVMSIPVVVMAGEVHAARVGASLLHALGQKELVANTVDEYIEKAVALALDKPRLRAMQANMRQRLMESQLTDSKDYGQHFARVLRETWQAYCKTGVSRGVERHGE